HMQVQDGEQQTVDQYETPAQKTEKKGQTQPKTEVEQKADSGDTAEIIKDGDNPECPDCGGMLVLQEGCKTCPDCGWSKC
ncbi:MAG: hypothetical protein ABEK16_00055, partial [Candidatus Nanohalobium sp.]